MSKQEPSSVSGGRTRDRIGYATCAACGDPLTDHEQYHGSACAECEAEFLAEWDDDDHYPRAA